MTMTEEQSLTMDVDYHRYAVERATQELKKEIKALDAAKKKLAEHKTLADAKS